MVIAALRRLPLHLPRYSPPRSLFAFYSFSSASTSASAKVADRIVKLFAIDVDGNKRVVVGLAGQTLLKALANVGLIDPASHRLEEIDACSAECEVHIAQEWLQKLPPPSYDERYVLTRNSRNRVLNKHARLGCQVVLNHDLQADRIGSLILSFGSIVGTTTGRLAKQSTERLAGNLLNEMLLSMGQFQPICVILREITVKLDTMEVKLEQLIKSNAVDDNA